MKIFRKLPVESLLKRGKKILIGAMLAIIVAGCAFWGWQHYQFKQSPQKALQDITQALQKGNREQLAMLINFRTLSENFARQILQSYPAAVSLPPLEILAENVQQRILDNFVKAEESKKGVKPNPYAPLNPMPADTIVQIGTSLEMQQADARFALVRAIVDYPRAEKKFTLIFQMEKKESLGWQLTKIVNTPELVQSFILAEQSIEQQKTNALAAKNAEQQQRMDKQMLVNSCTAVAGMLSDGKTALLTIEVLTRNPGPHAVLNFNLEASLNGKKHPGNAQKFLLNLAKRTLQGENLHHTWNITLDPQKPDHQYLLAEKTLQCTARFNNMGLSSGEVLFIRKNLQ